MKSILLLFDGVLKTQSAHVYSFLLLVMSNSKLLLNSRVDSFFSLLSLLKATKNICFFFLLHSTFLFWLKSWLVFVLKMSISLAQVYCGITILNEWKPSLNKLVGNESLKTSVWFNGSSVFRPQLSFFIGLSKRPHVIKGALIVLFWS